MTIDLLIPAGGDGNTGSGNDHDMTIGDVFLELPDKSFSIR